MTTKRTPGPWEVEYDPVVEFWDIGKAGEERLEGLLASVLSSEADARLIAVAPDMYKALPDLSHVITWLQNGCDPIKAAKELQAYQRRIDRAKAKAEGRE